MRTTIDLHPDLARWLDVMRGRALAEYGARLSFSATLNFSLGFLRSLLSTKDRQAAEIYAAELNEYAEKIRKERNRR